MMQRTLKNKTYKAFVNAFAGLGYFFRNERNGKIQSLMAIGAIISGIALHITSTEWMAILLCLSLVLSLEMLNSSIEKLCDFIHPSFNKKIGIIKDVAAGSVLFGALISGLIGAFIFLPKLWRLI